MPLTTVHQNLRLNCGHNAEVEIPAESRRMHTGDTQFCDTCDGNRRVVGVVHDFQVGNFITEVMVTDTRTYEVIAKTAKTITIRKTRRTDTVVKSENRDGNPYPCVWHEEVPDEDGAKYVLRLRKDGTYRIADWANPMRPATIIDGKVTSYTDYRM